MIQEKMSIDLISKFIRENYEIHEWKHACAILHQDFSDEWHDIMNILEQFRLRKSWIIKPGGSKSKVSNFIDSYLYEKGWKEKLFQTHVVVDNHQTDTPTHKVDCFKNGYPSNTGQV